MRVIKIGGSIQKDPNDYHLIAEKIKKFTDDKVIVVTSALKNVTNELLQVTNEPEKAVSKVSEIIDRHYDMLSKVSNGKCSKRASSSFRRSQMSWPKLPGQ